MYWVPLGLNFIASLLVGFNINYTDPDLFDMYSHNNTNTSHSPFIIVMKTTAIKVLPTSRTLAYQCQRTLLRKTWSQPHSLS
jgi:amino acid permease